MIAAEVLEGIARRYQTSLFPNVTREYFQHLFLSELYKLPMSEQIMFKGGTALRIVYGSPRFSEDLDFSLFKVPAHGVKKFVEDQFIQVLAAISQAGINVELGERSEKTSGGYFGTATFRMLDDQPVGVEINISDRNGREVKGEVETIAGDFISSYPLIHLPQHDLVEEKIFGALRSRKKPRDYFDLYFMMRKGMLASDQKQRLAGVKEEIITEANAIDFRGELGTFLPADHQPIIRDFVRALDAEINRQVS